MKRHLKFIPAIFLTIGLISGCTQANQPDQHAGHEQPKQEEQHGGHDSTNTSQVQVVWNLSKQSPESKKDEEISIQVQDNTGKPIEEFEISHEKKMHLIVVNKDLSFFNHIHPEYAEKGVFKITTQFPAGGDYKLIADFIPKGAEAKTESQWIKVAGDTPSPKPLEPEKNLTKTVEGKEVTLSFDNLQAGKEVAMTFTIKDAATKEPITNLQPYLGAIGHVVILSADAEKYIHNHPLEERATGPDAKFETSFPTGGIYKIWGQFQHENKLFVVPFVVQVP
ncbi:hypothetical protein [Ammoniphilus sp. 3BR4]|uniref:hypothetical protein n=1 Tax=Ammoniphilus sp. 3BR4 TaxID=3158265 RepID=UPI0034673989